MSADEVIESYDITEACAQDFGILSALICQNNIIKRTLKKFFQNFRTSPIPFSTREISLQKLNDLTRFVDFPRDFYDAIPFTQDDGIDKSFIAVVKNLHNPQSALKMLEHSSLPSAKSVKRLFTEKAGLFFYIEECAVLYEILGDINLLCTVLKSEGVYQIVSTLHTFSGIREFYSDYCSVRNAKSLCSLLINNDINNALTLNIQAIRYCALSPACKETEQAKWKKDRNFFDHCKFFLICDGDFSTPMCKVPEHIHNCIIDRFQFKWLITKKEYRDAGRQLHNCLVSWTYYNNPVVAVYKGSKIIAAIEVDGKHIGYTSGIHNTVIDKKSALYSSIKKWCNKFALIV